MVFVIYKGEGTKVLKNVPGAGNLMIVPGETVIPLPRTENGHPTPEAKEYVKNKIKPFLQAYEFIGWREKVLADRDDTEKARDVGNGRKISLAEQTDQKLTDYSKVINDSQKHRNSREGGLSLAEKEEAIRADLTDKVARQQGGSGKYSDLSKRLGSDKEVHNQSKPATETATTTKKDKKKGKDKME